MSETKGASSEPHFHIRWLPTDLLDWKPLSIAEAAERQAKRLVGKAKTYTVERFSASCRRCHSPEYSEPTEPIPNRWIT
jgi:hypothetical protein